MRDHHLLPLLAALGLAACQGQGAAPAPPTGPVVASGTLVVTDPAGGKGPFRLSELSRLLIDAAYQGEPGAHELRVDVTGPSGILFTQLRGPVDAAADGRGTARRVLEVRGTPIDAYHMTGGWKFTLVVDDTPLASSSHDVTD